MDTTVNECPGDGMNDVCIDANQFIFKLGNYLVKDLVFIVLNNLFIWSFVFRRSIDIIIDVEKDFLQFDYNA